jgi:hypothetical protein
VPSWPPRRCCGSERSAGDGLPADTRGHEVGRCPYPREHDCRSATRVSGAPRKSPVARPAAAPVVGPPRPIGSEACFPAEGGAGASWIRANPDCPVGRKGAELAAACRGGQETPRFRLERSRRRARRRLPGSPSDAGVSPTRAGSLTQALRCASGRRAGSFRVRGMQHFGQECLFAEQVPRLHSGLTTHFRWLRVRAERRTWGKRRPSERRSRSDRCGEGSVGGPVDDCGRRHERRDWAQRPAG